MSTPLGTFGVGQYTGTIGGNSLGLTTDEGFQLRWRISKEPIKGTNLFADALIDNVYRGPDNVQILTTLKEWTSYVQGAIWPYGAAAFDGTLGTVGTLDSTYAQPIVLSAVANTPAYTNGPVTLTGHLAVLAAENDLQVLMKPGQRDIPIVFDLLLAHVSSVFRFFTIT